MTLRFDLVINQGADFSVTFPVLDTGDQPQDLAGWSARAQVRDRDTDPEPLHDFADELAVTESDIVLTVPAAVSSAWSWTHGRYDLELVSPSGGVTRLVEGAVIMRPEITR